MAKTLNRKEQRAKQLLQRRTEDESALCAAIRAAIRQCFSKLVEMGYGWLYAPEKFRFSDMHNADELNATLQKLRTAIFMLMERHAQFAIDTIEDEYGSAAHIAAGDIINKEQFGLTAKQRIAKYTDRFKYEAEAWIAAGLVLGINRNRLERLFSANAKDPYGNSTFQEARKRSPLATRLQSNGKSYGRGQIISAQGSIERLAQSMESWAWREAERNIPHVAGWIVGRGSSYPCDLCQSYVGFHKDSIDLPPYHANCRCWAYPLTLDEYALLQQGSPSPLL